MVNITVTAMDRVLGCFYAMAAGDALGVPTSFLTRKQVQSKYGWIDTFYPPEKGHIFHDGLNAGEYTDDTEQSMALMNAFIRDGRVVPLRVVQEIVKWADRVKNKYASPLGPSTERALKRIAAGGDISETGKWGNTNGAAMRIAPLGVIHGIRESKLEELARDVALTDLATHNTKVCNSAATAIAWGVAECISKHGITPGEVAEETIRGAKAGTKYGFSIPSPNIGKRIELACNIVSKYSDYREGMEALYDMFGGGDLSADSIPTAIAVFLMGNGDVKKTIEIAVSLGGDCDTNGAMAGAMVGAMKGVQEVPKAWCDTIDQVNHCDFLRDAQQVLALCPNWHTSRLISRRKIWLAWPTAISLKLSSCARRSHLFTVAVLRLIAVLSTAWQLLALNMMIWSRQ